MEKQKTWQWYVILAVLCLTLYNILPTLLYYTKPLKTPIDAARGQEVVHEITSRVERLESDATDWLSSFAQLIGVHPTAIQLRTDSPRYIDVHFASSQEAQSFRRFLPEAGRLITFVPAQLQLAPDAIHKMGTADDYVVTVQREIATHLSDQNAPEFFHFTSNFQEDGTLAPLYRTIVLDRVSHLMQALARTSQTGAQIERLSGKETLTAPEKEAVLLALAQQIVEEKKLFADQPSALKRLYAFYGQVEGSKPDFAALSAQWKAAAAAAGSLSQKLSDTLSDNADWDAATRQKIAGLKRNQATFQQAATIFDQHQKAFEASKQPLSLNEIYTLLKEQPLPTKTSAEQIVSLQGRNPYVESIKIDWANQLVSLQLYPDIQTMRRSESASEEAVTRREKLNELLINNMAAVAQYSNEQIQPKEGSFAIQLSTLTDPQSLLAFDLRQVAKQQGDAILAQVKSAWHPKSNDLRSEHYPVYTYEEYQNLPATRQKLGLVLYTPLFSKTPSPGFQNDSLYIIARGLGQVLRKDQELAQTQDTQQMMQDFQALSSLLESNGFIGYPGALLQQAEYQNDYIFQLNHFYQNLLAATREDFQVKGSNAFATLDFTDVEQRILTRNRIMDREQEDLVKWRDAYNSAQVSLRPEERFTVPAPTRNIYWNNFLTSASKYFHGDERKILKWGLDLSGGKTVRIGLRDKNGKPVTNPEDLRQAMNELYVRMNKMGVSERTIRIENDTILMDFPGSQALSANELVRASAMFFHIVNEKFSLHNPLLAKSVNTFLQEVWNEAVVTNRTDTASIQAIAYRQLGGEGEADALLSPSARILREEGLKLSDPHDRTISSEFDETHSTIAVFRGDDPAEWYHQTHPLMIIFDHYALTGSDLENIQVGYDPSQGNMLTFGIKKWHDGHAQVGSPREAFYTWTNAFAEDQIAGTEKAEYSRGQGWRLAVILDDTMISNPPVIKVPLYDKTSVVGHFSQREVTQMATDLRAGSLSFTPKILSEHNVSPELGVEERQKGIFAAIFALGCVIVAMIAYYKHGGVVASIALIFNLLIMWAVLQNLGAALTLPGIAGLVLTMGMAVDANVLVFERVREELQVTGRISSAMQAGYRKAFSAIFDSNITTLLVAMILMQFDAGPIRSFAIMLMIGILSSMFTALFVTRYYFAGWVKDPNRKPFTMAQMFTLTHFDFLKQTRKAVLATIAVTVLGLVLLFAQRHAIFGMDFTGGYSLVLNMKENPSIDNYRLAVSSALQEEGAPAGDLTVQQLSRPNQLRLQLGVNMEEAGAPFHGLPQELPLDTATYVYQSNPRIQWVVNALEKHGLDVSSDERAQLQNHWSVMSGQFSDVMRNNAIIALALAFLAVLIYITFRFEWKYGISALIGLAHDVVVTLAIVAILRALGAPLQIDLHMIGALMTIIGYSLNDTIIVFDRVREDTHLLRKRSYAEVINHALNVTLSRTVMTSGTTLLVLLALLLFGGPTLFGFSLTMAIGILVGTFSSLFIAAPMLLYFHNREEEKMRELELHASR